MRFRPGVYQSDLYLSRNFFLTWEGIAIAATAISIGMGAYSAVSQGEAAAEAADYNAKVAENNAKYKQAQALDAEQRGATEAAQHREKVRKLLATQNAMTGASGIDTDSGTALDIMTETAGQGELDSLRIMNNAQREAQGYKVEADNYRAGASIGRWQGQQSATAGQIGAAGSIIGGIGSAAGSYAKYDALSKLGKTK